MVCVCEMSDMECVPCIKWVFLCVERVCEGFGEFLAVRRGLEEKARAVLSTRGQHCARFAPLESRLWWWWAITTPINHASHTDVFHRGFQEESVHRFSVCRVMNDSQEVTAPLWGLRSDTSPWWKLTVNSTDGAVSFWLYRRTRSFSDV